MRLLKLAWAIMPAMRQTLKVSLLLLLGALFYIIAAPPYEWSFIGWVALTPLFLALRPLSPWKGFALGVVYSILTCAGITYWLYFAISAYFPFSPVIALFFTLLSYSFFVGPYIGGASAGACLLMRSGHPLLARIGAPALWVTAEFARTSLFSGFSWELLGYTQYRQLTLIQLADITGVYGLSFLMALSSYVVMEVVLALPVPSFPRRSSSAVQRTFPWQAVGGLLFAITLTYAYGVFRLKQYAASVDLTDPSLSVAVVRSAIPDGHRWNRVFYASTLLQYMSATRQGLAGTHPDLVIWPEFAIHFYLDKEHILRAQLGQLTSSLKAPLLFGAPRIENNDASVHYYNSAYLLGPTGTILDVYDKVRLLPFAEYSPFVLPQFLPHSTESPTKFTAGQRYTIFPLPRSPFGVTICYEATYPSISRRLVHDGAQFLVNISNDTWLTSPGDAAAAQHFSMTVFRAVENKRTLIRAAIAGVSGFVDPVGRPIATSSTPEGVLLEHVSLQRELTVYARYGDWFPTSCIGIALLTLVLGRRQSPNTERKQ
jgi:apolipoprotein N-acyltransferase